MDGPADASQSLGHLVCAGAPLHLAAAMRVLVPTDAPSIQGTDDGVISREGTTAAFKMTRPPSGRSRSIVNGVAGFP